MEAKTSVPDQRMTIDLRGTVHAIRLEKLRAAVSRALTTAHGMRDGVTNASEVHWGSLAEQLQEALDY